MADTSAGQSLNATTHSDPQRSSQNGSSKRQGSLSRDGEGSGAGAADKRELVLKVTSIVSRHQREIAEKEAKLLSRLSHPSIIKLIDTCYRTQSGRNQKERPQHLILMEYCDGGNSLKICEEHVNNGTRFDLSTLIIAFGQICNAVSYLHAQRPPIVHRDLKPENFLVKNGAYKLCDFGSAVFGHVKLETSQARNEAEEVIEKTTTQMFRAPEMVDLFSCKKLTQATDVWALGACLFSLAYLQNCFEEGSNLAILSNKYQIPDENPYGEGLVDLIDRMLTIDVKARADMTEVILCLSAVYAGRPLPPRKERKESASEKKKKKKSEAAGKFNPNSQGITREEKAPVTSKQPKKIDPNSVAGRRLRAAGGDPDFSSMDNSFGDAAASKVDADAAFSTSATEAFANFAADNSQSPRNSDHDATDMFGKFEGENDDEAKKAFQDDQNWGQTSGFASFSSFTGDDVEGLEDSETKDTATGEPEKRYTRGRREGGGRRDGTRSKSKGRSVASLRAARPRSRARGRQDPDGRKEAAIEESQDDEGVEETIQGMRETMEQMSTADEDDARRNTTAPSRRAVRRTPSGGETMRKSPSQNRRTVGRPRSDSNEGRSRARSHSMDARKRKTEATDP